MLEKIILFILITFLLNQLPLNSKNKIFLNISIGILISIILEKDILQRIETIFLFSIVKSLDETKTSFAFV